MTVSEVSDLLHSCRGLRESFVQQTEHSQQRATPIRKQGGDGFEKQLVRYSEFRVLLCADSGLVDVTKGDLGEAVRAAFESLGMPMPAELVEAFPEPFDET